MVPEAVRAAIPAARTRSAETIRAWRASEPHRTMVDAFAACAADDQESVAIAAERLFARPDWAAGLIAPLVAALAADPLFVSPFRAKREADRITLTLFACPAATLVARIAPPQPENDAIPATIITSGRLAVIHYVRADGMLRRWRVLPEAPGCTALAPVVLADGMTVRLDGRDTGHAVTGAVRALVMLTAVIHAGAEPLVREYRIADGSLLRTASTDEGASRCEMLLSFLRAAGRTEAGSAFDTATRDPAFHLRWAAMREWLALDAHTALPRLRAMALEDPVAEVRAAAAATLARIAPRLAQAACRA